jgi:hypothetical protein
MIYGQSKFASSSFFLKVKSLFLLIVNPKMTLRIYSFILILFLALGSCADRVVCPAYQSSFIHDKETLRKKFSYFENDTVPKVYTASKTKYLVAVPESYRKRYRKMQTVTMTPVYPVIADSIINPPKDSVATNPMDSLLSLDSVAIAGLDSATRAKLDLAKATQADSVYEITKDREVRLLKYNFPDSLHYDSTANKYVKEKSPYYYTDEVGYNSEQENYMWFFRKELILPDVRLSKVAQTEKANPQSKEKKGFFRKLMFWKKDKKVKSDSLQITPTNLNEFDSLAIDDFDAVQDPTDSTQATSPAVQPVQSEKKKKGGLFKKKDKAKTPTDPNASPAKKEEDGF